MKIVKATAEEFGKVRSGRGVLREETKAVLDMEIDSVIRIVDHEHKEHQAGTCSLVITIGQTVRRHGMKVSFRHDGPDLLVMRIK